jgi:predicted 3-demethylubiquinone-9 3-methyltransferase (glyoxalase superfamily)
MILKGRTSGDQFELAAFPLIQDKEHEHEAKNTICLWFDKDALEAARFAATFPDSEVTAVHEASGDYPGGKEGDVLTVEFTVVGIPVSVSTAARSSSTAKFRSQRRIRKRRTATGTRQSAMAGRKASAVGARTAGASSGRSPRARSGGLAAGGREAKRAFEVMMPMKKIDIATIEAARRG